MAPSPSCDVVPITSTGSLMQELRDLQLLEEGQLQELNGHVRSCPEARLLARHLLQRGWLTAYQVNQLLQGRGAGLLFGSYVLLERLGEGGMGRVFKARQRKLERTVAIKVLRKDLLGDTQAMQRFQREIYAMAQLAHPNIVLALDAGEFNGQQFYVMEYVEGIDLARLLRTSGPLPVAEACAHVRQAALGLQHAFRRGLIHRDVKPANLLLARRKTREATTGPYGHCSQIKILDLGLARFALEPDDEETSTDLTGQGTVMGTPDYIAPEQAFDPRSSDIRSDLYSLGCTLYQLLAGTVPYPGGTALDKIFRHRLEKPASLQGIRPDVPTPLLSIVARLMAKQPDHRYQIPDQLIADLDKVGSRGTRSGRTLMGRKDFQRKVNSSG
jgi:serine/threonine protein kinase